MRAIVSTSDTLGGRWRIEGTRICVRAIRALAHGGDDLAGINRHCPGLNLTEEELAACLAWEFPATLPAPEVDSHHRLTCVCGEEIDDDGWAMWQCGTCGRSYQVTVAVEAL